MESESKQRGEVDKIADARNLSYSIAFEGADAALTQLGSIADTLTQISDTDTSIDTEGLSESVSELGRQAESAANSIVDLGAQSSAASDSVSNLGAQSGDAAGSVDSLGAQSESAGDSIRDLGAAADTSVGSVENLDSAISDTGSNKSVNETVQLFKALGAKAKEAFVTVGNVIKHPIASIKTLGSSIKNGLAKAFKSVKNKASELGSGVANGFKAVGKAIIDPVGSIKKLVASFKKARDGEKDVEKGAKDSEKALEKMAKVDFSKLGGVLKGIGGAMGTAFAAVGAAAIGATKALADMSVATAAYADEILTMSTVTGISTENLQAYKYAAELVDVSTETLTESIKENSKSMLTAQEAIVSGKGSTDAMAQAYKALGVSITDSDGSLRNSEDVYWETIDALGKMEEGIERDALAMQLFGDSAQELNPLMSIGSEGIAELTDEAKQMGAVMSDSQLSMAGDFDNIVQRLTQGSNAAKNALGMVLMPQLMSIGTDGVDLLGNFTRWLNEAGGDWTKISGYRYPVIFCVN